MTKHIVVDEHPSGRWKPLSGWAVEIVVTMAGRNLTLESAADEGSALGVEGVHEIPLPPVQLYDVW